MPTEHDSNIETADILVVDDESANLKLLSDILGREGCHVRPANSPRLAIDSALGKPPDLILLDIRMPDMDGFEVCASLKQDDRTRAIPILFISALHDTRDKVRAFESGGVDFITKPFQEEEVLARVRTHLKLYNMQRNLEELVARRTAELTKSEQLARLLLNATNDLTHLIDEDGMFLDLNEAVAARYGRTREELIGTCIFDLFPVEVAEIRRKTVRQALAQGNPIRLTDRHTPGLVFDTGVYPIETPSGEKGRVVIFAHDITEREEYQDKLKEREAALSKKVMQMRTIIDAVPNYIFAKDIDGRFLLANKAVADVFGVEPEEVVGKTDVDYGATEEMTRAYNMVDRGVIESQKSLLIPEEQIMRKDGTLGWFQTTKVPYQHPGYDKPAILGVAVEITERRKAEKELQKNRDYLEHLINSIPDAVFSVKLPDRTIEWGRDSYNVLGYELAKFVGKKTDQLYSSAEQFQNMGNLMNKAIRDGKDSFIAEAWVRNKYGESIPAEINTTIYRKKGEPVSATALVRDISFRKEARKALENSEERLRAAQRIGRIGDWELDLLTNTLTWSDEIFRIFEIDRNHFGSNYESFLDIIHPDDREMVDKAYTRSLKNNRPYGIDHRVIMPDGRIKYVHEQCETCYSPEGKPLRSIGTVQDITKRKEMEQVLKDKEEKLRTAQQIASLGYWEWDLVKDQLTWSDQMYQIYGLDFGTPVSFENLLDRVHPDDRLYRKKLIADLLAGKTVPSFSYRILRPDVSVRYIYGMAVLEHDDRGFPSKLKGTLQDVTEIKNVEMAYRDSETRLKQAQAEAMDLRLEMAHLNRIMTMNELAASFAHEINQPLGAIANNANVAKTLNSRSALGTKDFDEILDDIARDAQCAGQIIRKIRGIMKKGDAVYTSVDVNQLLDQVVALYQNSFSLNHVSVVVEKDPDLLPVKGDQIRLQQVLMNLIANAMDAMESSPQKALEFKTFQSGGMVQVIISDTGPGIETSYIDQIFDPFYTTKSEGMGIGLRLCKSIIEEHGGRIWAENNRDAGSTFYFTLKVLTGGQNSELA